MRKNTFDYSEPYRPDSAAPSYPAAQEAAKRDDHTASLLKPNICSVSAQSTFTGNIETEDLVSVDGVLIGNITTKNQVTVSGRMEGDLRSHCALLRGGAIKGNLYAEDTVTVEANSSVEGNIQAQSIVLSAGCRVCGDVVAKEISMERGASLVGRMEISLAQPAADAQG